MGRKLEIITNVAILLFVLAVGGAYLKAQFWPAPPPTLPQVKVGDRLSALPGYNWASHSHTLVLAVRRGCHFCEESAPFYKRLADLETNHQLEDTHILAVFPDDPKVAADTLRSEGLTLDFRPSADFRRLKISGTPTAILTDRQGQAVKVWIGKLPSQEEEALIETLGVKLSIGSK